MAEVYDNNEIIAAPVSSQALAGERSIVINLRIPTKGLEDNFKLADFQNDFRNLMNLMLYTLAKPKQLTLNQNGMTVVLDNNQTKQYTIERNTQGKIVKVTNTTDGQVLNISWEGI